MIWIELLVLAGQINDCGSIYFNQEMPYTTDLLSAQFGYPSTTIQLALTTFAKFGMIEIVDDIIKITNWRRYQNEEALERIRQLNAERQRRHRDKLKNQQLLESGESNVTGNVPSNVTCHEKCSYISISNIYSSLSKEDNEDKDKGCGGKGKKPKRNVFVKPTVEEVAAYCKERNNGIDPEAFFDKYEGNGWVHKDGNPVKDWKATVRQWERWRKEHPQLGAPQQRPLPQSPFKPDGSYDYESGECKEWPSLNDLI